MPFRAQPEGRLPYPACLPFLLVTWRHDVGAEGLTAAMPLGLERRTR